MVVTLWRLNYSTIWCQCLSTSDIISVQNSFRPSSQANAVPISTELKCKFTDKYPGQFFAASRFIFCCSPKSIYQSTSDSCQLLLSCRVKPALRMTPVSYFWFSLHRGIFVEITPLAGASTELHQMCSKCNFHLNWVQC